MSGASLPARWARLLDRLLPREDRGPVRAELERLFAVRVERDGRARAERWLAYQVMAFAPAAGLRFAATLVAHGIDALRDVPRAARSLARAPSLAAVVILTLALGTAGATLVFTLVDGVLIRRLPFSEPDGLVSVWNGVSRGQLGAIRERTRTLVDVRGFEDNGAGVNLELGGEALRLATTFVEPGLFDLMGAEPLRGRLFQADESSPGRSDVALLSEGLWRSSFGADPTIVGREIILDGRPFEVVGVMPASWTFPDPADRVWLPLSWNPAEIGPFWGSSGVQIVGRLAPGESAESAQAELRGLSPDIAAANPLWTPDADAYAQEPVVPLREALVADVRSTLRVLLAAVAMVLLVVCANVSSLLAARALERQHLVAVRQALGAGRARIAREAIIESLLLGALGTTLGVITASVALSALRPSLVGRIPRAEALTLDARALAISAFVGAVAALLAGLFPALRSSFRQPDEALRSGVRGGVSRTRRRTTGALVAVQVAAAVVLVTAATLLARTLAEVAAVDPGFSAEQLVTVDVTFPSTYTEDSAAPAYGALLDGVRAVPGVSGVSIAATIPFGALREAFATAIENVTTDPNDLPLIDIDRVSPAYFEIMGVPVLKGRAFTEADRMGSPPVVVVDELMAERFWPGEDPIGKRISYPWAGAPWMEVVGVVGSVADDELGAAREPRWYEPILQRPSGNVTLVIATDEPGAVIASVRAAVTAVDNRLPVSNIGPYESLLGESSARTRLATGVLTGFALAALLLGCLGVYGVAAHSVRERRREIGVRLALGARSRSIGARVLGQGLAVAGPGIVLGLVGAAAATRLLAGLLFGVSPLDPLTFLAVPCVILGAATLAVWLPARRAARVDPAETLREG